MKENNMKVQFEKSDIVMLVTAFGQKIVRVKDSADEFTYVALDAVYPGSHGEAIEEIVWRGSFASCLNKVEEFMSPVLSEGFPVEPDPDINGLLDRI